MLVSLKKFAEPTLGLSRTYKRCIAVLVDICICTISVWLAFYLRLDVFVSDIDRLLAPVLVSVLVGLPLFGLFGLYREIFRYSGWPAVRAVAGAIIVYTLFYFTAFAVITFQGTPRTIGLIQPLVLFLLLSGSRLFVRLWLGDLYRRRIDPARPRVFIYGAGSGGRQTVASIRAGNELSAVGYIDDNPSLTGLTMNGLKIYTYDDAIDVARDLCVTHVFLATNSLSATTKLRIHDDMSRLGIVVRVLPSTTEIMEGKVALSDFRPLEVEDVLGRDPVDPTNVPELIGYSEKLRDEVVLITGGGGSIGSELCRQVFQMGVKELVIVEHSEIALYTITSELKEPESSGSPIVTSILCSVRDARGLGSVVRAHKPAYIFHAAAYKHVGLVEQNVTEAVKNNILGTKIVMEAASQNRVQNFILISSDKAVRPTNVMGATKRFCELMVQSYNRSPLSGDTSCSMVRFGNVLGSSGSVVPKFARQINDGGPVTVTDPEVSRYFMTIAEACHLVLFCGLFARGGEVFVLDMGSPVKIVDLAKKMIALRGLTERTAYQPAGDIEIVFTGLVKGEKLREELWIENKAAPTIHPKIYVAEEDFKDRGILSEEVSQLESAAMAGDTHGCLTILERYVEGFKAGVVRCQLNDNHI
jgi:FlaA1/EpsC-like NDP-sugar epimerase